MLKAHVQHVDLPNYKSTYANFAILCRFPVTETSAVGNAVLCVSCWARHRPTRSEPLIALVEQASLSVMALYVNVNSLLTSRKHLYV
jgi:hypothetical protein